MNRALTNKMVAFLFIAMIWMPVLTMLLTEQDTASISEKRNLSAWVPWSEADSLVSYFDSISNYFRDHFGLREHLISINSKVLLVFNQSPVDTVIKGKQDWLFYKTPDPLMMLKLDRKSLLAAIKRRAAHVSYRANALKKQGIAYTYFVAPNKMSMYTEQMPNIYVLNENNKTYDLFSTSLDQPGPPFYFDLKKHLIAELKSDHTSQLYYRNDTHWNPLGAYLAYNGVVQFVENTYPAIDIKLSSHSFTLREKTGGDLANFINLNDSLSANEPFTEFLDCARRANFLSIQSGLKMLKCDTNRTTALFIGDSFGTNLIPYAAQSVGTLYVAKQGINHNELDKMIKLTKPDIVFEEIVERNLHKVLPY